MPNSDLRAAYRRTPWRAMEDRGGSVPQAGRSSFKRPTAHIHETPKRFTLDQLMERLVHARSLPAGPQTYDHVLNSCLSVPAMAITPYRGTPKDPKVRAELAAWAATLEPAVEVPPPPTVEPMRTPIYDNPLKGSSRVEVTQREPGAHLERDFDREVRR